MVNVSNSFSIFFPFRKRFGEPEIHDVSINCPCEGVPVAMNRVNHSPRTKDFAESAQFQCPRCAAFRRVRRISTFFFGYKIEID